MVIAISTSIGSRDLDVVIFDKTGTLTRGVPTLSGFAAVSGASVEEVLKLAASVEADSEHPLAKAIVSGANRRAANPLQGSNFEAMPGSGARATVNGQSVSVGGPHLLSELNVVVPPGLEKAATAWASAGQTVLYVVVDGRVIGTVAVEDEIRPESAEAVKELHDLGVRVAMITGDSHAVADSFAKRAIIAFPSLPRPTL